MAALVAGGLAGGALPLQRRTAGGAAVQADPQSLPVPAPLPPRGKIYGVDPMLMRIAMQKQMLDQRQKQQAVAQALRRGWENARRWHDEQRGPVTPAALLVSGRAQSPTAPQRGSPGVQARGPSKGMIRVWDSQGGIHDIPHESLGRAWQRDRGLKVIAG
jgi:hypothetical protein